MIYLNAGRESAGEIAILICISRIENELTIRAIQDYFVKGRPAAIAAERQGITAKMLLMYLNVIDEIAGQIKRYNKLKGIVYA